VWRWLNLAHLAGYVGLTHVYTRVNLLEGISKSYNLFTVKSEEYKRLTVLDVDGGSGNVGCAPCCGLAPPSKARHAPLALRAHKQQHKHTGSTQTRTPASEHLRSNQLV
jgi:hypothetical protein